MGYNVNTRGVDFTIPADKLEAATQALKELNQRDDLKSGGSRTKPCFSWMSDNWDETLDTAAEILIEVGFEDTCVDEEGLQLGSYGSKSGDEKEFLLALAHLVKPGSYVSWEGEDGQHWQDYFPGDGTHIEKTGSIVYS